MKEENLNGLKITQVQVYPFNGETMGYTKGLATVVLNDVLLIRGLRVMDGPNGLFVAFPLDPFFKGEDFRSIVEPCNGDLREYIEECVLEKYQATLA